MLVLRKQLWFVGFVFLLCLISIPTQKVYAQSPSFTHTSTQTINSHIVDVNEAIVDDVIEHAVRWARDFKPNPGIFASSRLSKTKHSGYGAFNEGFNEVFDSASSEIESASFYFSAQLDLSKVMRLSANEIFRVGILGAYSDLNLTLGPDFNTTLSASADAGEGDNQNFLAGAYALYAVGTTYLTTSVAGSKGDSSVSSFHFLGLIDGEYDTKGINANATLGHIVDLGNNVKIDGRAKLNYAYYKGDRFTDSFGTISGDSVLSSFGGALSATLYKNIAYNGMIIQPFTKAGVRRRFHHENKVETHELAGMLGLPNGPATGQYVTFDDNDIFWHTETGVVMGAGKYSYNASGYYEKSGDGQTVGGKIGVRYQF